MGWLDGKVALIVGGGSGIGRAVVEGFAAEGARAGVLELDPEKCKELRKLGSNVLPIEGDATSLADNKRAVREIESAFGRLDVLATFVGIFDYYTPLAEIPEEKLGEAFDEMFTINVESYLLSAKAALPELLETNGNVIFTVSTSGFYPERGGVLYVASKFAVRGLVVRLAHELAPDIRVNGVAPGGTLDTHLRGLESLGLNSRQIQDTPGREEDLRSRTPLQIALKPEDHAGAYVYLASERARGITGIVINSDGGIGVRG
jgi:2,3-dihydroxy-2,3-dihydrophenylpropionate dehydrogenase